MASLTGRFFGHYRILERIGRGGMATVYHADDRKAGRDVAVKFISPALAENEDFLKRFRREVKLVARLDHPNIVPVFDYGEQDGYAYVVMPRLRLGSLADRMKGGPLSLELGGRVLDQVAAALHYAHGQGVIHRDVKPSNILLDENGTALLGDFGLARTHEATLSLTGSALIGTPAYIAPELVRGEKADARCDQYSLGVILFELATGTVPFEATTPIAVALKHVSDPFPSARSRSPNVPESVERVILRATAKIPEVRFENIAEMNAALQAALAHVRDPRTHRAPTIELPPASALAGPGSAAAKRKRLRPLQVAAIGAGALLVVLAVPVFASGLLGLLERAASPAQGMASGEAGFAEAQATAQAATIAALSTEVSAFGGGSLGDDQVATAAMQTLVALSPGGGDEASLPAAVAPSGSTGTAPANGPSPTTASGQTAAPGPEPAGPTAPPPPGATPLPPTATPSPSVTPSPTATRTPTPTPTRTPTPSPTLTPTTPPPAPTATEDPCGSLGLSGFGVVSETEVGWVLNNGSATVVEIARIVLDWPAANAELDRIRFDGSDIWNDADASPPTDTDDEGNLKGNRKLGGPDQPPSKTIRFRFSATAQPTGYGLQVTFTAGCQVAGGG
jgi:serine/threonine-protein kinase